MSTGAKVVVVTGASRGIGLSISQRLMKDGFRIIGVARKATDELISSLRNESSFLEFDLADTGGIPQLAAQLIEIAGESPFGLVNNAGIGLDGVLATQHESEIASVLRVNLEAPILLTKYLVRHMLREKRGRIVNISSVVANSGYKGLAVYAASKAGIEGFSRSLSREVGKSGITVNSVAPGFILTNMSSKLTDSQLKTIERRSPLGLAEVADVASVVSFLMGPGAERLSGETIRIDAGSSA